ncbi:MAG: DMT family transporter [Bosea sp. (in: a-proteobacteria)]
MSPATHGLLFGLIGVAIFAGSVPATKLATIAPGFEGLHPVFIAIGRASAAGVLALIYLWAVRAPRPTLQQVWRLILAGIGIVIGFPLFSSLAILYVDAVHVAVITGALPLATAAITALLMRERASLGFWALAILGFLLVLAFAFMTGGTSKAIGFGTGDVLALLAVACASMGYVVGAKLSREMPPEHVISWTLVIYLPLTTAVGAWSFPQGAVAPVAWLGFAYVSIFSMWLGFFAWYRGLSDDPMRVSQVQLIQPFLTMLIAVPLLGERVSWLQAAFCIAIIITIAASRRMR